MPRKTKVSKRTLKKGHRIARAIIRSGGKVRNAYAVGVAAAIRASHKRKR